MLTKYSLLMWSWTMGHESLFDLSPDDLTTHKLLVLEATRRTGPVMATQPLPAQNNASTAPSDKPMTPCAMVPCPARAPKGTRRHPYDGDMS